ncbi:MAG TPA: hypothetical protein VL172_17730 [Kofleriaceae bacterium]|nr:hypothetical protein [Kofleriaceae bacterium]
MAFRGAIAALAVLGAAAPARAQDVDVAALPDVTDRDFALDAYWGSVLGSGQITGMGGAALATAEGSAAMIVNPASPASRPATSNDKWSWDWHIDWLNPTIGSDSDDNGIPTSTMSECGLLKLGQCAYFTGGLVGQYKQWALGVSSSILHSDAGTLEAFNTLVQVVVARSFLREQIVAGLAGRFSTFSLNDPIDPGQRALFSITGGSFEAGGLWKPAERNLRVGASVSLPVLSNQVQVEDCDPMDCRGYILPARVRTPWRTGAGVAWRFGPTPWNRKVKSDWRDEKSLTLAGDVVVTGRSPRSYGLEAFAARKLQPSGRHTVFSVRAGAEYEWLPGRLRVRGGSYWEPSRFEDQNGDDVPGRLHFTFGLEVRIWSFCFWGDRYRARLSLTADGADRYGNGAVSVGFWH